MKRIERHTEPGVALRGVSRSVSGRRNHRGRVRYALPDGREAVPERLVARRSRSAGFGAFRLPAYAWRILPHVTEEPWLQAHRIPLSGQDKESAARLSRRKALISLLLRIPRGRLRALVTRHVGGAVDPRKPGVPDLLVFKRGAGRVPMGIRFVEVKRPRERLAHHQAREIAFMRSLGFRAGVVRLIERE